MNGEITSNEDNKISTIFKILDMKYYSKNPELFTLAKIAEIISQLYELLFTTSGDPRKNLIPILDKCNITQNIFGEHEAFQRIYSFG
jgi:hypothetical protein